MMNLTIVKQRLYVASWVTTSEIRKSFNIRFQVSKTVNIVLMLAKLFVTERPSAPIKVI